MKNKIKKIICVFKGHSLGDKEEFRCYTRDGRRFKYHGRFFRCERCGALVHIKGIRNRELADLIRATLKGLPTLPLDVYDYSAGYTLHELYGLKKENKND